MPQAHSAHPGFTTRGTQGGLSDTHKDNSPPRQRPVKKKLKTEIRGRRANPSSSGARASPRAPGWGMPQQRGRPDSPCGPLAHLHARLGHCSGVTRERRTYGTATNGAASRVKTSANREAATPRESDVFSAGGARGVHLSVRLGEALPPGAGRLLRTLLGVTPRGYAGTKLRSCAVVRRPLR
jgi:hypothetical protein